VLPKAIKATSITDDPIVALPEPKKADIFDLVGRNQLRRDWETAIS